MGFLLIAAFVILFLLGFPIVMAIALPAITYLILNHVPIDMIAQRMSYALYSFPLIAVPIFIFGGSLMNSTEITHRIFKFADTSVGRLHGGLAQVNCFASLIFGGMSGAALADVGGLGLVEIKAMKEKGFTTSFSAAVTIASATVGPIFPPSIPLVLYGAVTGVSVVKLLLAGIIPGILCTGMLMIMTAFIAKARNLPRAERWPARSEILGALIPALPALLAPVILISGMMTGFFTPTEAAAVTVIYMIIVSALYYRNFTYKGLLYSTIETIKASAGILIIVSAASLFGWILAIEQIPQFLDKWIHAFGQNIFVLLFLINIFFIIVGMFLDATTAILLLAPIISPAIVAAGMNPVHLGLVIVFNLMIGLITPPMGLSLYLVSDIAKVTIANIIRDVLPYFIPLLLTLFIITYFPQLSLWIPSFLK
jgi:tripartite ATP-independent transporter DctM subunit